MANVVRKIETPSRMAQLVHVTTAETELTTRNSYGSYYA